MSFFRKIREQGIAKNSLAFKSATTPDLEKTINDLDVDAIEDALEEAGIETDIYSTFTSRPADKINLPEITTAKSTFVYNYFTRDERVRNSSRDLKDRIVSLDTSESDEILYRVKNKKSPRYVKLEIKPPRIRDSLISNVPLNELGIDLESSLDLIVSEGASSSQIFTGVEIIDTGREQNLYSMLKSAMFFTEIPTSKSSQKESAELLHNTLREKGGLEGNDKKLIVEALSNIKSEGYTLAPSDVPPEIAEVADDPIGKQSFSVQFNNLLMSDLIANSIVIPDNTFQDEIRGLEAFSRRIKKEIIASIPPANTFREADYDLQVKAVKQKAIVGKPDRIARLKKQYPKIKFVGYLIEKYEVLPDESVEFLGRLFVQGHNTTHAIDYNVRYGGAYFYKVRTVCYVKTIASSENRIDASLNQNVIATMLMASEGVLTSVNCVEKVAPPPPTSMRATFDFETLLPRISWQFPLNKQRDIKRFQIFKRFSIEEPFVLLKEYDFDNSVIRGAVPEIASPENLVRLNGPVLSFIDTTHLEGEKPIYAIACVDAHGMSSNYGPQIMVERDRYTNIVKRKIISGPNAPKPYPNLLVNVDAFQDCIKCSGYDRVKVLLDPDYYKLTRYKKSVGLSTAAASDFIVTANQQIVEELDLQLLAIDPNKFRYKLQLINIDNQKDAVVNIKLTNYASPGVTGEDFFEVSAASFSDKNISFQYGVE